MYICSFFPIYLSIYVPPFLSIYLSIYLNDIYLYICKKEKRV